MSTDVTPVSDNASSDSGKKTIFGHPILSADYRDDIDGLRSIAVLGVVLYHARMSRLTGGFSGVDIFFVISGYLIGGHVYGQLQRGQFSFRQFYRNRAKRILPALYAVLAAVFVTGLLLLSPSELKDLASATFATTASASNIWFCKTTGYFSASAELNPLLMTWSLGVEEQFYFVIPVLLAVLFRVGRRLILPLLAIIACASFVLTIYQLGNNPASAFYLPFSRSWELCGGVLFAIIEANGHLPSRSSSDWASNCFGWAGLFFIVAPFFLLNSSMTFPGAAALPSVLGAALILYSRGSFVNRRVLSLPPLMFVGRVSYSFYLIHWPVLAFLRVIKGDTLPQLTGLVSVFISFLLAVASYFLIETPFRSSKLAAWPLLARYGAVSLSILLISGIIFWNGGLRSRFPEVAELDSHAASSHEDPCLVSDGKDSPNLSDGCTAASESGPHLAVWGGQSCRRHRPVFGKCRGSKWL
jgi:peptidoglycan/LPS O-acetylase OafA/YrhL